MLAAKHQIDSPPLRPDYMAMLQAGNMAGYQSELARDGLRWWFEMDIPLLANHLAPLQCQPLESCTSRVRFLREAAQQLIDVDRMAGWYEIFVREGDREAACASVGAGIAAIWDRGSAYHRYAAWYARAQALLEQGVAPLAAASLHAFTALVEMTGYGDLSRAQASYARLRGEAERANSLSLRLFHAAASSYCLLWMGRFAEVEMLLADAAPLVGNPAVSTVCRVYFQTTVGLFQAVTGQAREAERTLEAVIGLPLFAFLPPPVYFLAYGHLLYAAASSGEREKIETIAERVRARAIPELNYFHYSYLHFSLGVAYLLTGQPHKTLLHSDEAMRRGQASESPIAQRMPALLYGQALSDLGRHEAAREHLRNWMPRWREGGFFLLAATAALELAYLSIQQRNVEDARQWYAEAGRLMPQGEEPVWLYRPPGRIDRLRQSIHASSTEAHHWPETAVVCVHSLGELQVTIGGRVLYDRDWKGRATKNLLKALIVLGGYKVSDHTLIDLLWPDAPADAAQANLKMALSRLRRLGRRTGDAPLPWVVVKQRHVSLAATLCTVDALRFQEAAAEALRLRSQERLRAAIELYPDDFLARDDAQIWVIRYRERLRDLWLQCVLALSDAAHNAAEHAALLPHLCSAVARAPCNEAVSVRLMRTHLALGSPAQAAEEFRRISASLQAEYGQTPGAQLLELAKQLGAHMKNMG